MTWSLKDAKGSREGVKKQIAAAKDIPDHWKTCLCADIDALDPKFNFVKLNVHAQMHSGRDTRDKTAPAIVVDVDLRPETVL